MTLNLGRRVDAHKRNQNNDANENSCLPLSEAERLPLLGASDNLNLRLFIDAMFRSESGYDEQQNCGAGSSKRERQTILRRNVEPMTDVLVQLETEDYLRVPRIEKGGCSYNSSNEWRKIEDLCSSAILLRVHK